MAAHAAKYLDRYAEPEAALADAVPGSYAAALVVPACREELSLLDGYDAALERASGRVLLILVINAADSAGAETHGSNQRLLADLALRFADATPVRAPGVSTSAWLGRGPNHDLLWLDRASFGVRVPEREGVGLARKIGADLAAALWLRGQISCPWIASSDADVTLPVDYFTTLSGAREELAGSAALLWPFEHRPAGEAALDAATTLYEISLRYYVLGLAAARSRYAYHSIGSTLAFDAAAYASVRGFPKRAAGEDFYLLGKLAKIGPVCRVRGLPIQIRARASDRVPFGTGRRAQEIAETLGAGGQLTLYAPSVFEALGVLLEALDVFAETAQITMLQQHIAARLPELADAIALVLDALGVPSALAAAQLQAPPGPILWRRVHTWFDALRSLRFIHALRDRCVPSIAWRQALAAARFVRALPGDASPDSVCRSLAEQEAALGARVGTTLR